MSKIISGKDAKITINGVVVATVNNIEYEIMWGCPKHERGLRELLSKFDVKSAKIDMDVLQVEPLDLTLNNMTFDDSKLKLWKDLATSK